MIDRFLDSIPLPAYTCDGHGLITAWNQHAVDLFGAGAERGQPIAEFLQYSGLRLVSGDLIRQSECPLARTLHERTPQNKTLVLEHEDGHREELIVSTQPLFEHQQLVGAICVLTPLSGGESSLTFSETIVRTAAEGICVFFPSDTRPYIQFSDWNDRMNEITGYTMEEINQLGWCQTLFATSQLQEAARRRLQEMYAGNDFKQEEWTIVRRDGQQRNVSISTSLIRYGCNVRAVALIQDITEQHRYEQALRESQDRLQLVIGASKLGLWDWNVSTGQTYLSSEWKHQLGYRDDELAATYDEWYSRLHPDDRQRVLNSLQEYLDGHSTEYAVEYRIQHKDRSYRWVHSRGIALYNDTGQPTRMLGCQLDFTEQKRTEETLRHILQSVTAETGQAYFSQLTDYLTRVCNVDYSFAVEFDQCDPNLARTVAYSYRGSQRPNNSYQLKCTPCEIVLKARDLTYFPCDLQQKFPDDQMLVNERIHCFMGIPLVSSSGQCIGLLTLLHTGPLVDAEQAKTLLRVVAGRSSAELERHQAEVAVRTSEQTLSKIAATMPHALYIFDLATQSVVYRNREVARELGYREDQISALGNGVLQQLLYPEDYAKLHRRIQQWQAIQDGQILETVYRMRHASGEYHWFNCRSTVYERAADGRVTKIIGTTQDISERKQAEEDRQQMEAQMQHAQKLESLGVLAGGIAHDFNNLLATILGYTELALQEVPVNSSAKQYLTEAVQGVNSATDLTRQLLAYSGKGRIMAERTDLSTLVTETSRLLDVSISKKCTLNYQLDPHLPACEVDIGQIRQVIMNLIINASEAIGDDIGVISIHTYARKFHKSELESLRLSQELQEGEFVVLDVSDTGCGIAADMQKKLFDPFFSTKFAGRGLGLAAVQGIIHTHGGAISVESQLHQGAKFRVLLPASDKPVKPKTVRPEKSETWQGQGTVLIADDEETVLKLTDRMVRRLGFQTIIATDGEQAVSQFQNHADEICVVLLDVTMPKLDGLQVLSKIRDVNPQTPVIMVSGYDAQVTKQDSRVPLPCEFIQKPYRMNVLQETIRRVLETRSTVV